MFGMDMKQELLIMNNKEDVSWLCSLSESELDMLINLKMLVIQRSKIIGHTTLAEKFDLKMLRALAFVVMENLKEKITDLSLVPGASDSAAFLDGCNLLKLKLENVMTDDEMKTFIALDAKRGHKRPHSTLRKQPALDS